MTPKKEPDVPFLLALLVVLFVIAAVWFGSSVLLQMMWNLFTTDMGGPQLTLRAAAGLTWIFLASLLALRLALGKR